MNLPNLLTLLRLLLVPIVVVLYYLPVSWAHLSAAALFTLAAFTDWLDGYLARNLKQTTKFGAFLDPVADKLMVAVALVLVVGESSLPYLSIPAAIIVGREIVVSALREWMAELGKRTSMAVSMVAKIKTVLQMLALILLMLYRPGSNILLQVIGSFLLYVAAALTIWSMAMYLKIAWPDLTLSTEKE
ncbi:MAG: CDP-diacylglycerol--glycerol-3-phosphate 3-phosphatidyltransferase [Gammaproteobacteria bacterium]|nr:CDP-diacylglycerol--glycerol-3-phosphate 3-phosphatidyltransferase [Gammaproteobacteria bacterium]